MATIEIDERVARTFVKRYEDHLSEGCFLSEASEPLRAAIKAAATKMAGAQ